jgi:hypothetical protein
MKGLNVKLISILVIALLAVPAYANAIPESYPGGAGSTGAAGLQPAAGVEGFAPQAYSNYFYFFNHGDSATAENWRDGFNAQYDWSDGHQTYVNKSSLVFVNLPVTQVASYTGTHPKVRYATVQMLNDTAGGNVDAVEVYNGATFIKTVPVNWYTTGSVFSDFTLDMGSYYDMVRGMNMCLHVRNTDPNNIHWNIVGGYGAKAEW